ncbi:MAG TPA: peptidase T [Phycisphaerae bacterium]|nr:peptidase T [Phycisphaerae bacterium]
MDTLLDRFLRYVKVETTAVEDSKTYPSSSSQLELGKILAQELRDLKVSDARQDEFGIVMGTIPGNVPGAPQTAWLAHVDTSPEFTAKNVKPVVHKNYDGRDIQLTGDKSRVIKVSETEGMSQMKGKTLITTDGTTLLGADDKSGVATIMTATAHLMAHPEIKHGPIRVIFTCDEEVGHGTDKLDLKKIDAVCAYTLDGDGEGGIENETWSADLATVTVTGKNTHPGYAKGRMVNALRLASEFISRTPKDISPETTEGRIGFVHPYVIDGGVPEVRIKVLLRSFVTSELQAQADVLRTIARTVMTAFPGSDIKINVTEQYRNMLEYLSKEPRATKLAEEAITRIGLKPQYKSIRGGTDGSKLSEKGLPTPNLSVGMHNFHSPLEFAVLEQMESAVKVLIELAQIWGKER